MNKNDYFIIYSMLWWVVFFVMLPLKNKFAEQISCSTEDVIPEKAYIREKIILTSVITIFLSWIVFIILGYCF